ncbi:hypothetical protein [Candidatus Protofrankia californiensis]|uniref:hypothetical protein n=1 Tax=Candidatus Protofrankia californiensis TaxID=1839754 RepID=UPI00104197CC|nr:hypothetical protein [Candidatus Protofrankia californiensis]
MRRDPEHSQDGTGVKNSEPIDDAKTGTSRTIRRKPVARPLVVDRIETVTMAPEQRRRAVEALANLIVRAEQAGAFATERDKDR